MAMDGEVIKKTREGSCQVRTENDLLIVFSEPVGHTLHVGDRLRFHNLSLVAPGRVDNLTRGGSFEIRVPLHDIHDLRLPVNRSGSRTPSAKGLNAP
jgi:hypothetical protein